MIILVASVVLGTGVVIYGTSLFQTSGQQEVIATQGVKVWVNSTDAAGVAWGAVGVRNTGDKLVSVDNIVVRGAVVPYTNWYVDKNQTAVTSENFQSQFIENNVNNAGQMKNSTTVTTACVTSTTGLQMDFDGVAAINDKPTLCLIKSVGPTALSPGEKMIIYFRVTNAILSAVDSGSSTSVGVFAGKTGAPTAITVGNF